MHLCGYAVLHEEYYAATIVQPLIQICAQPSQSVRCVHLHCTSYHERSAKVLRTPHLVMRPHLPPRVRVVAHPTDLRAHLAAVVARLRSCVAEGAAPCTLCRDLGCGGLARLAQTGVQVQNSDVIMHDLCWGSVNRRWDGGKKERTRSLRSRSSNFSTYRQSLSSSPLNLCMRGGRSRMCSAWRVSMSKFLHD